MNTKILLGVVLLATLSNAGLLKGGRKREIASEFQECMNDAKPYVERLKGYFLECEASTRTNPDASDSSDQESDEEASKACFDEKHEADEGKSQLEACYDKIQQLPENERDEAMEVFDKIVAKVTGQDSDEQ